MDLKEGVELEMPERLYRKLGTAFRSNKSVSVSVFFCQTEKKIAQDWLYDQEPFVLARQAQHGKEKFTRSKTVTTGINSLWQMDLADLRDQQANNDGYRYMFTVIDVFSNWAWAEPVKTKKGPCYNSFIVTD